MSTSPSRLTMRAWAIEKYGDPISLIELPIPAPGPGEVLIRMRGAEVGEWDEKVRRGEWPMERPFPLILGLAGAGMVAELGDEVKAFSLGDPVFTYSYPLHHNGAWAEFMLVPEGYAVPAPAALPLDHAGVVPVAGLTAHETLVDLLQVQAREIVLVTAAASGVGHLAVQIAAHLGARVVATTATQNLEFVRALGAETVIDHTRGEVLRAIREHYPDGVDKALNCARGEQADEYIWALREGGHIVDLHAAIATRRPKVRITNDYVPRTSADRLRVIASLIDEGLLEVEIYDRIPFELAPEALETVLHKPLRGKVGLKIE